MATVSANQKAKITLYWLEKSRSHRVLWLLEELGLEYELKTFKRTAEMRAPPELKEVHPLGKSPVITVQAEGADPITIAESGAIVEYLIDHYGKDFLPQRYATGKEGPGLETEEWLRYRQFMHYAEGTIMPYMLLALVIKQLKGPAVPFLVRPITRAVASKIEDSFLNPNFESNYNFLESQLATSPDNGKFLAGSKLTGADIMMVFPLEAGQGRTGLTKEKYPKLIEYLEMLHGREAYKRAIKKVEDTTGEPFKDSV